MKNKLITFLICLSALTYVVNGQNKQIIEQSKTATEKLTAQNYKDLLDKLKSGDTAIDFRVLRMSYTETKNYSAYGLGADERSKLFKAFNDKKFKDALKLAEKILETNYVEMNSHYIASVAYRELGDQTKSEFHKTVFTNLINSIIKDRDGKSAKTAFEVICVPEEYLVLNFLGYQRGGQSLANEDGHKFDILTVIKPDSKEQVKLYFNIDIVWKNYEKLFGK